MVRGYPLLHGLYRCGPFVELDADLVANQSKRQKWKNAKLKSECREAFRCVTLFLAIASN